MNQPRRIPKIKTGDCFIAPLDGLQLYYQQQTEDVIHINASNNLVCILDKGYIVNMYQQQRPIARILQSEFKDIAGIVFNKLGCCFIANHDYWELPQEKG